MFWYIIVKAGKSEYGISCPRKSRYFIIEKLNLQKKAHTPENSPFFLHKGRLACLRLNDMKEYYSDWFHKNQTHFTLLYPVKFWPAVNKETDFGREVKFFEILFYFGNMVFCYAYFLLLNILHLKNIHHSLYNNLNIYNIKYLKLIHIQLWIHI